MNTYRPARIFTVIALLVAAFSLAIAGPASAKRTTTLAMKKLTLGTGGAEDYLFTAGNTVAAQATADPNAVSTRFQIFDPVGNPVATTACSLPNRKRTVAGTYTIQPADPTSTGAAWAFELQEFTGSNSCTGAKTTQRLYFDVAKATAFAAGAPPSAQQSIFPAGGSAYVRVAGMGVVKTAPGTNTAQTLWTTSWILPSGATACADTGLSRPSSSATGAFPITTAPPATAQSFLQYAPAGYGGEPFNAATSYSPNPCPAFATGNQGQWSLKLQKDATHFVTLRAFSVDATAPDTTITSAPSGTQNTANASFQFTSADAGATFECAQVAGAAAPTYSSCSSPKTYSGLAQGAHTFFVRSTDGAGNVDGTPASVTWNVDTVGPGVTLVVPAPAAQLNDSTPALSGAAGNAVGDSTTVTVEIYQGTVVTGSPDRTFSVSRGGTASWSVPDAAWAGQSQSPLPDGTYVAVAKQADSATPNPNVTSSDSHVFFVDTQAPSVSVLHPAAGKAFATGTPDLDGTAGTASTDAATVTVEIFSGPTATGIPAHSFVVPTGGGVWSVDAAVWAATAPLTQGTWTVRARQTDAAGNTGTSFSRTFTVDLTAPDTTITSGPGATTADQTADFRFSSTEAGATFTCALDGASFAACPSPKIYNNIAAGPHTLQVAAVDAAGNGDSSPATWTWTVDTTVPTVTLTGPADGVVTSDTTPAISGTAGTVAGDSATVTVNVYTAAAPGAAIRTLTTTRDSAGTWSLTIAPALPDGTYVYHAEQVDAVPNTGFSATRTITVDTAAPATTITQAPADPTASTQATLRFASSKSGSTFACSLDGAAFAPCSSPVTYSGLPQGSHTFDVRATDPAGNTDPSGATATWTIDSTVPNVAITSPADGVTTRNRTLAFSGTAAGGTGPVTLDISRFVSNGAPQPEQQHAATVGGDGSWSTTAFPALDDGTYVAHAERSGTGGTGYSADRTFTIDGTPPDTTISGGPGGLTRSTFANFQLGSSEPGSTFECNLDAGGWGSCSSPAAYSSLTDGQHTLDVRATDGVGNLDPTPAERVWTIDAAAPAPAIAAPAEDALLNNANPTFSGTTTDASAVTVEIYSASDSSSAVDTLPGATPVAGAWAVNEDNGLDDGDYVAYATQTDAAGNSAYSDPRAFTIDTAPPGVTLTALAATTNGTPAFSGQAGTASGDDSTITVKIYSGGTTAGAPVRTLNASRSGGGWTVTPGTPLASGQYTARAEQTDMAGNLGKSDPQTFNVDGTAPTTTITGGPSGSTDATTADFTFTSNDSGATFQCKLDGGSFGGCNSPKSYSGLGVGSHTFQVRATDSIGNVEATPQSRTWTITAPVTTPPAVSPPGPTQPGPSSPGPSSPPADTQPPSVVSNTPVLAALKLTVKPAKKQSLRTRVLVFTVSCSAACSFNLSAFAKLPKQTKVASLKRKLPAGKKVKIKVKLSKKAIAKLALALRSHKKGLPLQVRVGAKPLTAKLAPAKAVKLKLRLKP